MGGDANRSSSPTRLLVCKCVNRFSRISSSSVIGGLGGVSSGTVGMGVGDCNNSIFATRTVLSSLGHRGTGVAICVSNVTTSTTAVVTVTNSGIIVPSGTVVVVRGP